MNKSYAIVAVAYNRENSLNRLLSFLKSAEYPHKVTLVISIDKSEKEAEILSIANEFEWSFGSKIIRTFNERQGLRNHILACGDLTQEYDSVTILEDDLIVSPNFFNYTIHALNFYRDNENIAGISLYAPTINEMSLRPFTPMPNEFDSYFMQSAQSWGQCWSRKMWQDFRIWYDQNTDALKNQKDDMPDRIYSWPESSWKKYYMKYIVETSKYFVYPYISLSSNASDIGHHNKIESSLFQVPLFSGLSKNYKFPSFDEGIKYDIFFERDDFYEVDSTKNLKICVDLYGEKKSNHGCQLILSNKNLPFKIKRSYSLSLRPHECNYIYDTLGDGMYLYDIGSKENINIQKKYNLKKNITYYSCLDWKQSGLHFIYGLIDYVKSKF